MPTLYPPTGHLPTHPKDLERETLDEAYNELRVAYRGLPVVLAGDLLRCQTIGSVSAHQWHA